MSLLPPPIQTALDLPGERVQAAREWRRRSEALLRAWGHQALPLEAEAAREARTEAVIGLLGSLRSRTGTPRAARIAGCGAPVLAELRERVTLDGAGEPLPAPISRPSPLAPGVTWTRLACRDRWCPACQRARAEELVPRVAGWIAERAGGGVSLALLTLTRPKTGTARQAIDEVLGAWDRLSRAAPWGAVRGYLRALELVARRDGEVIRHRGVQVRARGTGVHAHLHAVLEVDLEPAIAEICARPLSHLATLRDLRRDVGISCCARHAAERPGVAPVHAPTWVTWGVPACDRAHPCDRGRWARGVARGAWWAALRRSWLGLVDGAAAAAQDLRWYPDRLSDEEALREARELGAYAVDGLAGLVDEAARDPRRRRYAVEVLAALDGRRTLAAGGSWSAREGGLDLRPQARVRGVAIAPQPIALVEATRAALWLDGRRAYGAEAEAALDEARRGPAGGLRERVQRLLAAQ